MSTKYKVGSFTSGLVGKGYPKRSLGLPASSENQLATTSHQPHGPPVISAAVQKLETAVFNWGWVLPSPCLLGGLSVSRFVFPCIAGKSILGNLASAKRFERGNASQPY